MIVQSTRFGEIDVSEDRVIDFGDGLLGFPESTSFILVEIEDDPYYFWFQSVTEAELAFLVTRPWDFYPDYEIDVPDDTVAGLGLEDPAHSEVFLLLTVQTNGAEATGITANLLGPLVVNTENRRASQVVQHSTDYSTREPLGAS